MLVVSIVNQKGGVAKTTTAMALAAALRMKGFRVLLADTDPRRDATDTYRAVSEDQATIYDVLVADEPILSSVQHTEQGDILASDKLLEDIELKLTEFGREYKLAEALEKMGPDTYDFVVIDTPPQPGIILNNVLMASDICIIPITPDRFALRGVEQLDQAIARIRSNRYGNPKLKIGGFLITKCDMQLKLTKETLNALPPVAEAMKTKIYKTIIREAVAAKNAQAYRMGLYDYAPDCNPAADYVSFAEEFLADLTEEV